MNDFGKRDIFFNLTNLKQATKKISIYLICFLVVVVSGLFIVEEAHFLLVFLFLMGLIGLVGLWITYFNSQKNYQSIPYLMLDESGLTINENGKIHFIGWQDIAMIDMKISNTTNGHKIYYAIETTHQEYVLNQNLLADKFDETIILIKRYAENYNSSLKFIY
ncbi:MULTISPECIES: hypothetical protein [unclassified Moraxella]|uniref:hypothetical protein n=1 Tax=unclassified Moraxella TaxID=2685852 RepID=UPI003AF7A9B4